MAETFTTHVYDENDDEYEAVIYYELLPKRRHQILDIVCPVRFGARQHMLLEIELAKHLVFGRGDE